MEVFINRDKDEATATSKTIAHPEDTDGAAQYSSDTEPSFPTNLQRTKRQRAVLTHVRCTPAAYAIQPATKLVRDRLVADGLKQELSRTFDASKLCLPEKMRHLCVQDVPLFLKLGLAKYASTSDLMRRPTHRQGKNLLAVDLQGMAQTVLPERNLAGVAPLTGDTPIHSIRLQ
ncbi:hypothetical protein E4U50_001449 [Claviceps purpurea]|nr:hypothetical protein E4U50_001449 [Claviceps purpurea]